MSTPFTSAAAVAALEAAHPSLRFCRRPDGSVRGWGHTPAQAEGIIDARPLYFRFRRDTARLDLYPAGAPAAKVWVELPSGPVLADTALPPSELIETTATIYDVTGDEYAGDFATVEEAVDVFERLLAAQEPVSESNPTYAMRMGALLAAFREQRAARAAE